MSYSLYAQVCVLVSMVRNAFYMSMSDDISILACKIHVHVSRQR
jgi:hypothetical protein